jgi:uncharacterized protein YcbK (DUF882 family)
MKYFKMKEFECHDGCEMPASARANIEALVEVVLDPARERLGKAIRVNSGYRCPKHNLKVGGAVGSQHMKGEAAGVVTGDSLERLVRIIKEQGVFDQMIVYPTFVHVSYKRIGTNRHQVLKKVSGGYASAQK